MSIDSETTEKDAIGRRDVLELAKDVQAARKASSVQGLALHARVRARRKDAREYSEGSVVKVRSDSVDVRFDSDGTVQKKLTGVVHDDLSHAREPKLRGLAITARCPIASSHY